MANQMVTFPSSMAPLEPGQIFTVRSMTWVIGLDGNGEIMEAVQDHPTLIALTLAMTSLVPAPHRWIRRSMELGKVTIWFTMDSACTPPT